MLEDVELRVLWICCRSNADDVVLAGEGCTRGKTAAPWELDRAEGELCARLVYWD